MAVDNPQIFLKETVSDLSWFWGNIGYVPVLVQTKDDLCFDECLGEKAIFFNPKRFQRWGGSIAQRAGEPQAAGDIFFSHAVSHFGAYERNHNFFYALYNPNPDPTHIAIMEAVANYPTKWLLDKKGFNGKRIMEVWYSSWDSDSRPLSEKIFNTFCSHGPDEFMRFVSKYSPHDAKTYQHLLA